MALPAIASPAPYDLRITQGSTFTRDCVLYVGTIGDTDLTGCTFAAKIRDKFGVSSSVIIALSVASPGIAVGQFTVSLTAAQTTGLSVPAGTPDDQREALIGVWDIEITNGATVYRFAQGSVYLSREVTF